MFFRMLAMCLISFSVLPAVDIVIDAVNNKNSLPANFRTVQDPFPAGVLQKLPSREGFDTLKASGSAQFSRKGLKAIVKKLAVENLAIIDLRQECHGHINDMAVGWHGKANAANKGKVLKEIEKKEQRLLRQTLIDQKIFLKSDRQSRGKTTPVYGAMNEETLAQKYGVQYLRVPVQDNCSPTAHDVNRFIDFVKQMPSTTWLHFHCRQGIGRTSTFLVIYDMMRNAKKVALEDITARHGLFVGFDLLSMPLESDPYYSCHLERRSLIMQFYTYCRENNDNFDTPFVANSKL